MQNIVKAYNSQRKQFGKQPLFSITQTVMLDTIIPCRVDQKLYGLRNPINRDVQASLPQSEHEINTRRVKLNNHGMNHAEGGWPSEIHYNVEDETSRYRRRIERDDDYVNAVMTLAPKFEKFIKQNNAIEMYQQYFKGMEETTSMGKSIAKINNAYRDPEKRPVAGLSWTHEEEPKLAVSYCSKKYPVHRENNNNFICHLWHLENPNVPSLSFLPPAACWDLACSPMNPEIIIGGLEDGRVCVFDFRADTKPVSISPPHTAHRDPVTALLFIHSRQTTEFFTSSSDGQCMWYDIRNISQPLSNIIVSVNVPRGETVSCSNADGISSIQFDRNLPTRFLAGTETGLVVNVNRKGANYQDMLSSVFDAHIGPVRAVHRSPCSSKMFLSCGDWRVHIWSEEIKTSPIITGTMHRHQIMDAAWAPEKLSGYMTVSVDGKFRFCDLLRSYREPVVSLPISEYPLQKIVPHAEGRLVALGGIKGTVYLLSLSDDLVTSNAKDKSQMLQTYDRNTRREQLLASRVKEIYLKFKSADKAVGAVSPNEPDEEALVKDADEEYRRQVIEGIRIVGAVPVTTEKMRKR